MRIAFKLILLVIAFSSNAQLIVDNHLTIKKVREQYTIAENKIDSCINEKVVYYFNHYKRVIVYWDMRNCGNVLTDELFYKDNKIQSIHYFDTKKKYMMEEYKYDSNNNINYYRTILQNDSVLESVVFVKNTYQDELLIKQDYYKEDSTKIKTKSYHYNSMGILISEKTSYLKTKIDEYKIYSNGKIIESVGKNGIIQKWEYNSFNKVKKHSKDKYHIKNYFYDENQLLIKTENKRLIKGIYKLLETEHYRYNNQGDLITKKTIKSNGEVKIIQYHWTYNN